MTRTLACGAIIALSLYALPHGSGVEAQPPTSDHSQRFKQYKDLRNLRDADLATMAPAGQRLQIVLPPGHGDVDANAAARTSVEDLETFACGADAVITGTPTAARSDFTAEGTFIFTEYTIDVQSVLRGASELVGTTIPLAWPGGSLVHKGRPIEAIDQTFQPLTPKRQYLLFLRHIGQGAFEGTRETAGYDITATHARSRGAGQLREPLESHALVALTRTAASNRAGCRS